MKYRNRRKRLAGRISDYEVTIKKDGELEKSMKKPGSFNR
jgi:hypothetical protein